MSIYIWEGVWSPAYPCRHTRHAHAHTHNAHAYTGTHTLKTLKVFEAPKPPSEILKNFRVFQNFQVDSQQENTKAFKIITKTLKNSNTLSNLQH